MRNKNPFLRYSCRTVNLQGMKILSVIPMLLIGFLSISQSEDNEILRVKQLRDDCVERSKCVVSVYPNPSSGPVKVEAPRGAICKVFATSGTYVGTWTVYENGLSLSDLPTGSYIMTVTYNGISRRSRVVIL